MIFKELILKDFLTFKGVNTIRFPDPDKHETALILVLAPNFAGKTNVIRALEFLLYGRLRRNAPASEFDLLNKSYLHEAADDETLEAWVQATIVTYNGTKTFRRRIEIVPGQRAGHAELILEQINHERTGDKFFADSGSLQRILSDLVPECLFDYFYFQGETLANQLSKGGSHAIHEGLATLLHKDEWESAIDHVDQVRRRISKDIQRIGTANREYADKEAGLGRIRDEIRLMVKELTQERDIERTAKEQFSRLEDQIKALSRGTHHENLNTQLEKARRDHLVESRTLDRLENNICEIVGESKGTPFFNAACKPAMALLEQMQSQNLLPADVTEGFVERLLKADKCICGRLLSPAGKYSTERTCINDYRKRAMAVDLNHGLMTVMNMTESGTRWSLEQRVTNVASEARRLLDARMASILRVKELHQDVIDLEDKRAKSKMEEIAALQASQRQAAGKQAEAARKQWDCEAKWRVFAAREKLMKEELDRMVQAEVHRELKDLHAMQERANELLELITDSFELLMDSFRSSLQKSVSRYYDQNTRDGTTAVIDQNLLPRVCDKKDNVLSVLGGAQQQLLVLAHIISIAELRRSLHTRLESMGIMVGKLDDQSFFLDSVFAPCDPNMAGIVADFLPKRARQMMVLVAPQQWHESIRTRLEEAANLVYSFHYFTPKKPSNIEDFVVKIGKAKVPLYSLLKGDVPSYTRISEVK